MAIFEITIDQGSLNEQNEKKKKKGLAVNFPWYWNLSQTSLSSRNDNAPFTVASHIKSNCH